MALNHITRTDELTVRGRKLYTYRYAAVDTGGQAITFPIKVQEFMVHYEGSTAVATITGEVTDSTAAYITSDGITDVFPVAVQAGNTAITVAAASGTIDVSIVAWG